MAYPDAAELVRVREKVRTDMAAHFAAVEELLRRADAAMDAWHPGRKLDGYELALLGHLARGTRTTHGIVQLAELLFGSLALMATRVAFEIMVSAYWMSLDRQRAARFDEYGALECAELRNGSVHASLRIASTSRRSGSRRGRS